MSMFLDYKQAKKWASKSGITNSAQWKRTPRPANIPSKPYKVYSKKWVSWSEFLKPNVSLSRYVSYEEAKQWAKDNNITNIFRFNKFRPINVRRNMEEYPEFTGWDDFLCDSFVSYEEAKQWAKDNNITSFYKWRSAKSKRPKNVPSDPNMVYTEFTSYIDFFDNRKSNALGWKKNVQWATYEEAKRWAKDNNIKTSFDWIKSTKPYNIPSSPHSVYQEWVSWNNFLDKTDLIKEKATYEELKKWAKENNIKTSAQWCRTIKPKNFPKQPERVYPEWTNWFDFLGKQNCSISIASTMSV